MRDNMLRDVITKILSEVDHDIGDVMLQHPEGVDSEYEHWQLLQDPVQTILKWQELRDRKHDR